jgi:hypothetical protein
MILPSEEIGDKGKFLVNESAALFGALASLPFCDMTPLCFDILVAMRGPLYFFKTHGQTENGTEGRCPLCAPAGGSQDLLESLKHGFHDLIKDGAVEEFELAVYHACGAVLRIFEVAMGEGVVQAVQDVVL